ncbi:hypothetical protein SK128_011255 [Halocaridina rubra]|uniref:Uncharacterized protein n=1 Tax=Halocaridina rubra TaxID=373956 RepID=A0AAN8ZSM2_HALRR
MFSRDGDSVMEDALQVVGIYKHLSRVDAYHWRAVHLLTAGFLNASNADELKKLIHRVDEKLQRVLCNKMTAFIKQVLYHPKTASCKEKCKAVTGSVLALE